MDFTPMTDTALLAYIRQDHAGAFRELFSRHWERLYQFAFCRLKSEADAKDIVQELFIKLWLRRTELHIDTTVEAYLNSIVHYEVLSCISRTIKDSKRKEAIAQNILPDFTQLLDPLQMDELLALVEKEVNKLPEKMQQVYRLNREENLSVAEIAGMLHVSEQTVRNQLNTAIKKLRSGLKEALLLAIFIESSR